MNALPDKRLSVIGAGNIGRILLERLRAAGVPVGQLTVCDSDPERAQAAAAQFGVRARPLTDEAVCSADLLLIATPPKVAPEVLQALAGRLRPGQTVISFAAAVPLARLEALAPSGVAVARVMPNAASLVGQGINPVAYGASVTREARALMEDVLAALGQTLVVRDSQMNWCVGLTGAAMRSVLPALAGMTQAGIEAGLSASEARRVAAQVLLGTAALALQTDLTFDQLKALTPMETLDEAAVSRVFQEAARRVTEKIDRLQRNLAGQGAES
jgi:pyrroline-5-carboxylate reductase